MLLDAAMTARESPEPTALGRASYRAKRAAVYIPRVREHARATGSGYARVLALTLAHEVGHLLLPEYSHARSGLMRPTSAGRVVRIPDFMTALAATIWTMLTAAR
jgi:hypothetical protein